MGGNPGYPSNIRAGMSLSGFLFPNHWPEIRPDSKPYLDFHGTADPIVPYEIAEQTHEAMENASMVNGLIALQGQKHVPWVAFGKRNTDLMGFLTKHMNLDSAECPSKPIVV